MKESISLIAVGAQLLSHHVPADGGCLCDEATVPRDRDTRDVCYVVRLETFFLLVINQLLLISFILIFEILFY
jgi:hypothetical protein